MLFVVVMLVCGLGCGCGRCVLVFSVSLWFPGSGLWWARGEVKRRPWGLGLFSCVLVCILVSLLRLLRCSGA